MAVLPHATVSSYVSRDLFLSQIVLFGCVFICHTLLPNLLAGGAGVSNYGTQWPTIVPYSLALLGSALYVGLAAGLIPKGTDHAWLRVRLYGLAAAYLAVLLSTYPYKLTPQFNQLHKLTDVVFILYELRMGALCAVALYRKKLALVLLSFQILGSILMALSFFRSHTLFTGQLIEALSFALLLVLTAANLSDTDISGSKQVSSAHQTI
jgi:hypothetical protein